MTDLGKKIQTLRKGKNLTQADLGEHLNVTAQAVSKWESDSSEPDLETLKRLCSLFDVSMNYFLGMEEEAMAKEEAVASPVMTKIIVGYCGDCKKPLSDPSEYMISDIDSRRIICKDCAQERSERLMAESKATENKERRRGLIWGSVIGGALLFLFLLLSLEGGIGYFLIGLVLGYASFTLTAQLFYSESVMDCMDFFLRSFHLPGLIFSLDLDGLIWFITVKLLFWVVGGILSLLCFGLGLFVTGIYAAIAFPFTLTASIRENK